MKKEEILEKLRRMEKELVKRIPDDSDYVDIKQYQDYVRMSDTGDRIWTDAIQTALWENKAVYIPKGSTPYYIDKSVIIPSGRHIRADAEAVIRQIKGGRVLMFRNEHTVDGTRRMPDGSNRDYDISIIGGRWEESFESRAGYGRSGMYDEERSFYGVSTCMLFNNIRNLYLKDMVFAHTAGFSVQAGEISDAVFENITFEECYADGLHINGNTETVVIRNIKGSVGDDLVALNMYDWQNSSVNFGPMRTVLCEKLCLSADSRYKAMRIEPGTYYFEDGASVDCSVKDLIVRDVTGINTFKLYFQTPSYKIGETPERGAVGSGDNLFFENITIDLNAPIDHFSEYLEGDRLRGAFAAFEFGADIGRVSLENISLTLYRERFPMSFLACVGPKSIIREGMEIFDPYLSSTVKTMHTNNIVINGERVDDLKQYLYEIEFNDVNRDGYSTARGKIEKTE